jgi:hypothetical protein
MIFDPERGPINRDRCVCGHTFSAHVSEAWSTDQYCHHAEYDRDGYPDDCTCAKFELGETYDARLQLSSVKSESTQSCGRLDADVILKTR